MCIRSEKMLRLWGEKAFLKIIWAESHMSVVLLLSAACLARLVFTFYRLTVEYFIFYHKHIIVESFVGKTW